MRNSEPKLGRCRSRTSHQHWASLRGSPQLAGTRWLQNCKLQMNSVSIHPGDCCLQPECKLLLQRRGQRRGAPLPPPSSLYCRDILQVLSVIRYNKLKMSAPPSTLHSISGSDTASIMSQVLSPSHDVHCHLNRDKRPHLFSFCCDHPYHARATTRGWAPSS